MRVHLQLSVQRREGPLGAFIAFAQATGYPDRSRIMIANAVRVDNAFGVLPVTSKCDGVYDRGLPMRRGR